VLRPLIRDVDYLDMKAMHEAGMSAVDIGLKLGYSDKTIRKWIKRDGPPRYTRRRRPSKLDPYKDYIMGRMADGVFNCEILIREIRSRGYEGGITILKEFVSPHRRQFKKEAVRRFETEPGEQGQMDWGYLGTFELDGQKRKVWCFAVVLGYSRYLSAHCTTSMDLETVLLGHQRCFEDLGGIPSQIVYDNMKTVVLNREPGGGIHYNPRFFEFANHYRFKPVVHRPYRPRSKGKVERSIGYIKDNFCPGRSFSDLTDLNLQLSRWLEDVANVRIHGTTHEQPVKRFFEEPLRALPEIPFATRVRFPRKVARDGYLSYLGVLYSVPWRYAGAEVEVEEHCGGGIRVHWHGEEIASHEMPRDGGLRVSDPSHSVGLHRAQLSGTATGLRQCYPDVQQRALSVYEQMAGLDQ